MGLGYVLGFYDAALMILYVLVLVGCHMTNNKCMKSVIETTCNMVAIAITKLSKQFMIRK